MSKKKIWHGILIYCIIIIVCLGTSSVKASVSEGQFNLYRSRFMYAIASVIGIKLTFVDSSG